MNYITLSQPSRWQKTFLQTSILCVPDTFRQQIVSTTLFSPLFSSTSSCFQLSQVHLPHLWPSSFLHYIHSHHTKPFLRCLQRHYLFSFRIASLLVLQWSLDNQIPFHCLLRPSPYELLDLCQYLERLRCFGRLGLLSSMCSSLPLSVHISITKLLADLFSRQAIPIVPLLPLEVPKPLSFAWALAIPSPRRWSSACT